MRVYNENIYTDVAEIEKKLKIFKSNYREKWSKYDLLIKQGDVKSTPIYDLINYLNKLKKEKKIIEYSVPKIDWRQGGGTVIVVIAYKDLDGEFVLRNIFI